MVSEEQYPKPLSLCDLINESFIDFKPQSTNPFPILLKEKYDEEDKKQQSNYTKDGILTLNYTQLYYFNLCVDRGAEYEYAKLSNDWYEITKKELAYKSTLNDALQFGKIDVINYPEFHIKMQKKYKDLRDNVINI